MAYHAREKDFVKSLMNSRNKQQLATYLRDEMVKKDAILDFITSRLSSMSIEDKKALAKTLVDAEVMEWEIHKSDEELNQAIAEYCEERNRNGQERQDRKEDR